MGFLTLLALILGLWLMLAVLMTVAWWIEQRTANSGWVDVMWTSAMGITGIAGATAHSFGDLSYRQLLIVAMVLVWALRLSGHIAGRTTTVSDDPRYAKLRLQWGTRAARNMFWLLQAQAALSMPMIMTILLGAWNPAPLFMATDWIAAILFCIGLGGSALADLQLTRFKKSYGSSGRLCDTGLWAWSRHPNYFFEWLVWVAFALFAINISDGWNWGYVALIGPACMYWLLRYVSGVPPLEEHMLAKYGAAYAHYQKSTSVFFPLPPSTPSR
jgi:steroid 5-alpha reductase family enzyme